MKVMKFGGGCLKNGEHFVIVSEIIKSEKSKIVVVVSAVSGITNLNRVQKNQWNLKRLHVKSQRK